MSVAYLLMVCLISAAMAEADRELMFSSGKVAMFVDDWGAVGLLQMARSSASAQTRDKKIAATEGSETKLSTIASVGTASVIADTITDNANVVNSTLNAIALKGAPAPASAGVLTGYVCCAISVLGFGSNYVPVKTVDTKDGVFFTLCLSCGVLLVGLIQWGLFGFYKFEPFAMLGGMIWAVGNACVPFIIQKCGLSGQLVWSVTNMLTGWATGTFGWFGKEKDTVEYFGTNVIGVIVTVLSLAPFALMKEAKISDAESLLPARDDRRWQPEPKQGEDVFSGAVDQATSRPSAGSRGRGNDSYDFAAGFLVALVAGVFMGSNFDPPTYLQQIGPPKHSADSMDYVISHFSGIFLASLAYFLAYLLATGKKSFHGREVVLPGLGAGVLWAIAQVGWFKANSILSYVIAFPIIVATPGVVAAIWGVLLFGENRGGRNSALLSVVVILQAVGVTIIALSKGSA